MLDTPPAPPTLGTTLFTVGHSNRSLPEFIDVLRSAGIQTLVDVRRFPASRRHPHFNIGPLRDALAATGADYYHLPELGGYREAPSTQFSSPNDGWPAGFLRNYADYALTDSFRAALDRLYRIAGPRWVVMCAERRWTDCHRQIIADYLIAGGHKVIHLVDVTTREDGRLTPFAECIDKRKIRYPAAARQLRLDL